MSDNNTVKHLIFTKTPTGYRFDGSIIDPTNIYTVCGKEGDSVRHVEDTTCRECRRRAKAILGEEKYRLMTR